MLGKNAGGLFWMFRYLERSENVARLVDAGFRIAMTRSEASAAEWRSIIVTSGASETFETLYSEYNASNVVNFLLTNSENASSVMSVIDAARRNARLVRTVLTREVWESVNDSWMMLKEVLSEPITEIELPSVLSLIRQQSSQTRGAMHGTMLRNDAFNFCRLGTFVERVDSIARILDVKYYVLLPSPSLIGSSLDNVQWQTILRAASGERAFGWLHGDAAGPINVADFLICDRRMPRSLAFSTASIVENLNNLAMEYQDTKPCNQAAKDLLSYIGERPVDEIFEEGLHEFIASVLQRNSALAAQIEHDYQFTAPT